MEKIPVELLCRIIENLECPATTHDGVCTEYDPQSLGDLTNVRLVCKAFRDAAWKPFGTSLSARRFRLFEASLQDLKDISNNQQIAPYITTFSLGMEHLCVRGYTRDPPGWFHKLHILCFDEPDCCEESNTRFRRSVEEEGYTITAEERDRLRSMCDQYKKLCDDEKSGKLHVKLHKTVEHAVKTLRNLCKIRICSGVSEHLTGWPGCDEKALLQRLDITTDQLYSHWPHKLDLFTIHAVLGAAKIRPKVLVCGADGPGRGETIYTNACLTHSRLPCPGYRFSGSICDFRRVSRTT